jgi:hypothetical protein
VHIVGLRRILLSLFTNPSDGEHEEQQCNGKASNYQANNGNNNPELEQLITMQN